MADCVLTENVYRAKDLVSYGPCPPKMLATKVNTSRIKKMKNRIFAMPVAAPAMPPNPSTPATIAITKNTTAQYSIAPLLSVGMPFLPDPLPRQIEHPVIQCTANPCVVMRVEYGATFGPVAFFTTPKNPKGDL